MSTTTHEHEQMFPGSPQATAHLLVQSILKHADLRAAWPALDEPLRREFVEGWVEAWVEVNPGHSALDRLDELLVDPLIAGEAAHPLWPHFATAIVDYLRSHWDGVNLATWGWAMDPRPLSVDTEVALLVDHPGDVGDEGVYARAVGFVLRHDDDGWRVTSLDASAVLE